MEQREETIFLALMDFATCYPEAISFKKMLSVAEDHGQIFLRVGSPKEILSD